jgi:hypothetical protein
VDKSNFIKVDDKPPGPAPFKLAPPASSRSALVSRAQSSSDTSGPDPDVLIAPFQSKSAASSFYAPAKPGQRRDNNQSAHTAWHDFNRTSSSGRDKGRHSRVGGSRGPVGPGRERLHASAVLDRSRGGGGGGGGGSGGGGSALLGSGEDGSGWETQRRRRLVIVELPSLEAGRETDSANHMLSEARAVATSMNALIKVLQLRCHPHPGHIPYRDSKLTLMLRDSLQ